ncbi:tetratricopeptide (TPR) repeat protein [Desulfobaculum xiamenense]|uniref:Tetratricopeptide (TPR) repeat protein n=1 Tax=Desulfobaculum xiamenense TaxID=995050 RepID=A0A846QLC1_9BACT|nr:tetratricopeptide repeat protein [Desulfobaculum xiamenense]NJB68968.1 tetratricopeptide (TPR) repeat protein [Desulfobaculum xiamenense]
MRQYEKTIIDFVAKENGCFFILSHDATFVKMMRTTLNKELVIGTDRIRTLTEEAQVLREMKTPFFKDKKVVLLVERLLNNRNTLPFIKNLKTIYDDMYVVVLTSEVERQVLILLHEMGVGNFITKPVSMATLIEKIAFTIRPQGKIGQHIERARQYFDKEKYDEALEAADRILEMKPGSAAALMIKGDVFKATGRTEEAVTAYSEAHDGAALYLEPLKKLAELYRDEGDLNRQLEYLEKLDRLSPLNVERKISMGEIHMEFGNVEAANQLFEQAVENARKEALSMIEEVKRSIAEKCIEKAPDVAERFFRSILDSKEGGLKKSDIETFNRLGIALRRQGRWNDAVSEYEQALKIAPDDENLHFNVAIAYSEGRQHAKAVVSVEKALTINPDLCLMSSVLCFNIAVMYSNAGMRDKAIFYLKKTLEVDPDHQGARKLLGAL